ncbi:MAG: hypothetical protein GF418_06555 [Chitinivibrionales bacterium]|nr:hypothetical protein [Chitinivibrionales bacterium]
MSSSDAARHPWERARFFVVKNLLKRYARRLFQTPCVVADIGCGDLYVLRKLAGCMPHASLVGVDSALDDLQLPAGGPGDVVNRMTLHVDAVEALNTVRGSVDCLLLLDVLEHIADENQFLASLLSHRSIGPDTVVLATAPAFQCLFSAHDSFLGHHRRYSAGRLLGRLRDAGLHSRAHGYFFTSLLPIRMAQVIIGKTAPALKPEMQKGIGGYRRKPLVDELMSAMLMADFMFGAALGLLNLHIPGLSVYAVCKKQS